MEQSLCVLHDISDKETVLIDSGYFTSPELLELLKARGKRVPAVLCTHLHVDHIGNNGLIQRTFGSKIYVARKEKEIMEQRLNHQGAVPFKWMEPEKYFFGDSGICKITAINDKDKAIKIGGAEFKIERLSGHSPDHLGFATPDGVLHIGDSMMTDMVLKKSKIPYEFNITSALETLERFKVMDYPYFAASHMDVVLKQDMPKIAGENIAFHNKVLDEMEKNLDVWKEQERFIEETITGRGVHIRLTRNSGWLPSAIRSYLGHLIRQGRITRKTENGKKYIKRITIKAVEK